MSWFRVRAPRYNSAAANERRPSPVSHQTILVLDFGSQYTQLIARRLRELSVHSEIVPFNTPVEALRAKRPAGLILSGGPRSVSEPGAPKCVPEVFAFGVPVLGICYGMQLMTDVLGGDVRRSGHREFGHAHVRVSANGAPAPRLFTQVPAELRVWASHGDDVAAVPPGFSVAATSATAPTSCGTSRSTSAGAPATGPSPPSSRRRRRASAGRWAPDASCAGCRAASIRRWRPS